MIAGICKARNEGHILKQTLDNWATYCDRIHIYDDCSQDSTPDIAHEHPAVVEVVTSDYLDPDRLRAEWYNRNLILQSAMRFKPEWVAYFDADEWIYGFDTDLLKNKNMVSIRSDLYDVHITPEDIGPGEREWVDPAPRLIPFFFRHPIGFEYPDQRIMNHHRCGGIAHSGKVKHWGKGWSEDIWERKVEYYGTQFGRYADKWKARKGKAVKHDFKSDFGQPLARFDEI